MTLDALPVETLLHICKYADRMSLRSLRLVSKGCLPAATEQLFTDSEFVFGGRRLLNVLERSDLRVFVRYITFDGQHMTAWPRAFVPPNRVFGELFPENLFQYMMLWHDIRLRGIRLKRGIKLLTGILRAAAERGMTTIRSLEMQSAKQKESIPIYLEEYLQTEPRLADLFAGLEEFKGPSGLAQGDKYQPWFLEAMPNLRTLYLNGSCRDPNHGTLALMMSTITGDMAFSKLRSLTLVVDNMYPWMFDSPLFHQPSVQEITLISIDLRPAHELRWKDHSFYSGWDYQYWQDFLDAFATYYEGWPKQLMVAGLAEDGAHVDLQAPNPHVRILPRWEMMERLCEM